MTALLFSVNKDIVDILVGEILFDADRYDEVASFRERAFAAFSYIYDDGEMQDFERDVQNDCYGINTVNSVQFNLPDEYLTVDLAFRQVARIILDNEQQTRLSSIDSINESSVLL